MSEKKLVIIPKKFTGESMVTSMRLPKDMLAALDKTAAESGRTRNELMMMCLEFALENLVIEKK